MIVINFSKEANPPPPPVHSFQPDSADIQTTCFKSNPFKIQKVPQILQQLDILYQILQTLEVLNLFQPPKRTKNQK